MSEPIKGPQIRVHGPDVKELDVREAGEALSKVFDAVASSLLGRDVGIGYTVGAVRRACDGCEAEAPSFELPQGWTTHPDGDDLCVACTARWMDGENPKGANVDH